RPGVYFEPSDRRLLLDHEKFGCLGAWCETPERAHPFVFRRRLFKRVIPAAQLIYCRDLADFVRFAPLLGRFLARHGLPLVIADADGPIPGLLGIYWPGKMPKYFRGPQRPRLGDLAYTETAMFGI